MSHSTSARALALALALLGVGATSAAADTISVTAGPDPAEEVPVRLDVRWTQAADAGRVYVTAKPAGSSGCGATYAIDAAAGEDVQLPSLAEGAAGARIAEHTFRDPGAFVICGYLQDSSAAPSARAVTGPITVDVRSARASLALSAPVHVSAGARYAVTATVSAERPRRLFVTIRRADGHGCAAAQRLDASGDRVLGRGVGLQETLTAEQIASKTPGTYLLCGYVQEWSTDAAAEATASTTFVVAPDGCDAAKTALAKAQQTMQLAEAAVTRFRALMKRKPKTYRRSYATAVRTRANARRRLAAARGEVRRAC